ncbi:pyridoxamine 5'-phosphate oxidase family protein [Antrihabitans cavernicola]|uniref:Pyridoxamine 5'-phosphate oxidase family protein n=1 Tax=Antrihabitans cavernicola TaxID=2495913 RepID=A0A5A7SAV5_9NOCA|nr:pyridoxamine 5'-phosphate oxidase family protein [Spelaeibacter cavernicola]KAA0023280.1 pyridoxamine 5'-phosphate oxidase family protein [Spelaeibacter cavernicola]
MTNWTEFAAAAPRVSETFVRRHKATGNLCMLATLRADGSPRISPVEPRFFEGELWIVGMPNTTKFDDLARDPRFCLHTATVDTEVKEGDAKLWGVVEDVSDDAVRARFTQDIFDETGMDCRDEKFDHFFRADLTSASSVQVADEHMDVTIWKAGQAEKVVRKH